MKANNLILGAIYINALSGQPCRLVNIVSCEGAWLESFDGSGYGVTVPFDAVHYASQDEVDDYLEERNNLHKKRTNREVNYSPEE